MLTNRPSSSPHFIAAVVCLIVLSSIHGCEGRVDVDLSKRNKADEQRRHVEAAGGFSFVPPDGWEIRDVPDLKFKLAVGPATSGFAPNINVTDVPFGESLDTFVEGNIAFLRKESQGFRLVQQGDFKTAAGEQGARVVSESAYNGSLRRHTCYFFTKGGTKFVITCTTLAEGGDKLDSVFETSIMTFRFDKK